ncbi:AAA family ATPase [Mucilaginibacter paludis]|uniref:Shikimate kinase n=1 Tax=Mucilaginibacter paludis DSM 18603 TaxID=714943 RepID=H1Y2U6_9SPHI|nr:AAA family ATPase [Mucilaginibacter paludis]EHQ28491.1 shikimate kinase [Mucilaginibacter paludis DSM 18603]
MKIHIFGASGSGVTTLGQALSRELNYPYFDSDDYFWELSNPPFTVRRNPEARNQLLIQHLSPLPNWILGGSIVNWDESWNTLFDLVVFLLIPAEVRMERLKKREFERYGEVIYTDPEGRNQYEAFLSWASGYDDSTTQSQSGKGLGRTLQVHRNWIDKLTCQFIEIPGDTTLAERINKVLLFTDALKM